MSGSVHRLHVLFLVPAICILIFSGCATVPVSQRQSSLESLLYKLETGDADTAVRLCRVPFLLDGEILLTENDLHIMWSNLSEVPGLFSEAQILSITPVPPDYTRFSQSSDVRVFFERALPENPALVEIESPFGRFQLLVSGKKFGVPVLVGLKGPVR